MPGAVPNAHAVAPTMLASDRPSPQQRLVGAVRQRRALSDPLREAQGFLPQGFVWHDVIDETVLGGHRDGNLFGRKSPLISEKPTRSFGVAIDAAEHRDERNGLLRVAEPCALTRE
jgi:hypothetical protein